MTNDQQLANNVLEFLQRAPLEGREAETMVLCKQWVRKQVSQTPTPSVAQVADTADK